MIQRDISLRRLGELELERSELLEQIELLKNRLTVLDKEYSAIRNILSLSSSDGRWASQGTPLLETVYHMMKGERRPLHYKEILDRLNSESFYISGTANIQNLVVRLNRDKRFIKIDRGIYGLAEWGNAGDEVSATTHYSNKIENISNSKFGLTISEKREIERTKFILQSIDIDIQITQNNIKALRDKLLGHKTDYNLPDNIDPKIASMSFERKLINLLEQKNRLNHRLEELENKYKKEKLDHIIDYPEI